MPWKRLTCADSDGITEFAKMMRSSGPWCARDIGLSHLADEMSGDHRAVLFLYSEDGFPNRTLALGFTYNPTLEMWRGQYGGFGSGWKPQDAASAILTQAFYWMIEDQIQYFYFIVIAREESDEMRDFFSAFPETWIGLDAGNRHTVYRSTEYVRVFLHSVFEKDASSLALENEPARNYLAGLSPAE